MKGAAAKVAAAAAVLLGIWAGVHVHSSRTAAQATAAHGGGAVPVPVGESSPPTQSDLAAAEAGAGMGTDAGTGTPEAAAIPVMLPEFSLSDREGHATSIAKWRGKSLILNFWATWCAPCRREIPLLKSLSDDWAAREVEVVGVAVDHRDNVVAYAENLKIPYPLLVGEEDALDVAAQLGVGSPVFPFTVFTDRRGEIVTLYIGELHRAQADLILARSPE